MPTNRLYFIDVVRAFAILMMLQGHFIDTLLAVEFRDPNSIIFSIWQYFRGITAPMFFTISGLIFTYLLYKAQDRGTAAVRIRKGISRGFMLIGVGYLLRIPIFRWFTGQFDTYFLVIDVLQCIGLSLILIVLFYKLTRESQLFFSILMLFLGVTIFLFEPFYRTYDAAGIPLVIANYLTKENGSIFTIIPWFGYMALGAFMSTLFHRFLKKSNFKFMAVIVLITFGLLLVNFSTLFFKFTGQLLNFQLLIDVSNFNYLFIRLGNVLVIFGLIYAFENYLKQSLILKIGQKTLSIYVIHFVVLYGSFTGWGLNRILGKNLTSYEAIFGAILFLSIVSLVAIKRVWANNYMYQTLLIRIGQLKQFINSLRMR